MNKSRSKSIELLFKLRWALFFLLAVLVVFIIQKCVDKYEKESLKNYNETWAVYWKDPRAIGTRGKIFYYFNQEKTKVRAITGTNLDIEIGDTVWIKYSTTDNKVIDVVSMYADHKKGSVN